jgi:uncharacterized protein YuzE
MKLHYDPETDSLYIELRDAPGSSRGGSWKGLWSISTSGRLDLSKVETIALPAATAAE